MRRAAAAGVLHLSPGGTFDGKTITAMRGLGAGLRARLAPGLQRHGDAGQFAGRHPAGFARHCRLSAAIVGKQSDQSVRRTLECGGQTLQGRQDQLQHRTGQARVHGYQRQERGFPLPHHEAARRRRRRHALPVHQGDAGQGHFRALHPQEQTIGQGGRAAHGQSGQVRH